MADNSPYGRLEPPARSRYARSPPVAALPRRARANGKPTVANLFVALGEGAALTSGTTRSLNAAPRRSERTSS